MLFVVGICIGDVFVLVANLIFETSFRYFFIQSYFVSAFIARNSGKKIEVPGIFFLSIGGAVGVWFPAA